MQSDLNLSCTCKRYCVTHACVLWNVLFKIYFFEGMPITERSRYKVIALNNYQSGINKLTQLSLRYVFGTILL